jgi:hypothetical protein
MGSRLPRRGSGRRLAPIDAQPAHRRTPTSLAKNRITNTVTWISQIDAYRDVRDENNPRLIWTCAGWGRRRSRRPTSP